MFNLKGQINKYKYLIVVLSNIVPPHTVRYSCAHESFFGEIFPHLEINFRASMQAMTQT